MDARFDLMSTHNHGDQLAIADIAFVKRNLGGDRAAMAARQVIQNNHLLAARTQQLSSNTSYIAGAAGHENCHFILRLVLCA